MATGVTKIGQVVGIAICNSISEILTRIIKDEGANQKKGVKPSELRKETSQELKSSWFGVKDLIPANLRSRVIYKFAGAGRSTCYVGETNRHFATRIHEHLSSDTLPHL